MSSHKLKKPMHPDNVLRTPPDYTALAIKYKDFRRVCKLDITGKVIVNFKNEKVLRALAKMLLQEYFELDVDFAPNSLIPTVALRLNYILWIEDLMKYIKINDNIKGVDIGCGSSCIYSLLIAKKNQWQMFALESNEINIEYARKNVINNNLQALITIISQSHNEIILEEFFKEQNDDIKFNFCLCNPPFFNSALSNPFDNKTRSKNKRPPPPNCRTGTADELTCPGGELNFVERIIDDSLKFKERIGIYSSMLGVKNDLTLIKDILESKNIKNYCTTEFCQGNTTRWGIAWSFSDDIKLNEFKN